MKIMKKTTLFLLLLLYFVIPSTVNSASYFSGLEISNISSSPVSQSSVYIKWDLNTSGASQVEYGLTTDYGNLTNPQLYDQNNYVTIEGLNLSNTYHYRIKSYCCHGSGAVVSGDYTFNFSEEIRLLKPECKSSDWFCGDWGSCSLGGTQTRTCSKILDCDGGVASPATTQSCIYKPTCTNSSWSCGSWSSCSSSGNQTRTCSKNSNCEGGTPSPVITQSCVYREPSQSTETSDSFTIKIPVGREDGVRVGDKVYIKSFYNKSMIGSAF